MAFIDEVRRSTTTIGDVIKRTYGPLAALNLPLNEQTSLRYPLNLGDSKTYPHTVEFQAWLPEPTKMSEMAPVQEANRVISEIGQKTGISNVLNKIQGGLNKAEGWLEKKTGGLLGGKGGLIDIPAPSRLIKDRVEGMVGDQLRVNFNQKFNSRWTDFTRRAVKSDRIALYLPHSSWDDSVDNRFSAVSMTEAFGMAGVAVEAGSAMAEGYRQEAALMNKIMSAGGAVFNSPAAAEVGGKILGTIVGGNGDALAAYGLAALGYAINPQEEMLYGGTEFREFMFEFTMTPRDIKEATAIHNIIQKFKYHASPAYTDNQGRWIVPPSYFDITFKFGESRNPYLPAISTCALRNVKVNYSGGLEQWATYEDGMPIQVQMTLTFVELEMMHKALRDQGY